jgi:hypothetical protein
MQIGRNKEVYKTKSGWCYSLQDVCKPSNRSSLVLFQLIVNVLLDQVNLNYRGVIYLFSHVKKLLGR